MKSQASERLFDTSKCQVKFRKPRILERRVRSFDQDRDLTFDHERAIPTRLQGVIFRDRNRLDFKNQGVSNIEEASNTKDWPKVEPARSPHSLEKQKNSDWEQKWGREETFEQRWSVKRRKTKIDPEKYLYSRDRTQPRLSYITKRLEKNRKLSQTKKGAAVHQQPPRQPDFPLYQQPAPKPKPKVEVVSQPIHAPPSSYTNVPVRTSTAKRATSSEKKRAFAFNEYALLLMESGEYERAMNYFHKALDLDSSEETYTINMNRCREWLDYKKKGGRR